MRMMTKGEVSERFCPLIGKNCIAEGCMYWTYSDGWNDTKAPSSENEERGYCKDIASKR